MKLKRTVMWCSETHFARRARLLAGVVERDGGGCFYCDEPGALTLDHITPKSLGGKWVVENLVLACATCNQRRGNMSAEDFLRIVKSERARGQAPAPLRPKKRAKRAFNNKFPWLAPAPVARRADVN